MSKIKSAIEDFKPDPRLVDERGASKERLAKAAYVSVGTDSGTLTVRQSPIERAVARNTINEQQGRAADKLYSHWYRASMAGSVGSSDPMKVFGTGMDFSRLCATEAKEFNWQRLQAACRVVRENMDAAGHNGRDAVRLLELVVCRQLPFGEAGQKIGYTGRDQAQISAIIMVRGALNILAREWGL